MPDNIVDGDKSILVSETFNERPITLVEWRGRAVFIAREVGEALGYGEDGKALSRQLADEWREEFIEGVDVHVLKGHDLAEFKALVNQGGSPPLVDRRAAHLLLLTEQGLHMVLVKTDKPAGRALRRWVVDTLIPAWRARHTTLAAPAVALPSPIPAVSLDELRYRVEGLERIAASGQLGRETARVLLAHAATLLVAGAGGRDVGGPQLPAVAMTGGEADHEHPGLVPIPWAAQPEALIARNQRSVPGLPAELDGKTPQDLMVFFVNHHHFFSDRAWRSFARWVVEAGILHAPRWLEVFNAAGKDPRVMEGPQRRGRRRPVVPEG